MFLPGHTVAIMTYWVAEMMAACFSTTGRVFDAMVVASIDKEWLKLCI